jgi:DNA-directed RNA polymerase subunit K/omega
MDAVESDKEKPSRVLEFEDLMSGYSPRAHITPPVLWKYERAAVLARRAQELMQGARPMVDVGSKETPYQIAKRELESGAPLPYLIQRQLPDGTVDLWRLADLVDMRAAR